MRSFRYCALALVWTASIFAADKKETELAARYDYVGIVTRSRNPSWNKTGDTKMSPVDPEKVPKRRILVGIRIDRNDEYFPLKGRLYIEGFIYDTEWDVMLAKDTRGTWVGWDDGDDVVEIEIIQKGAGYRQKK